MTLSLFINCVFSMTATRWFCSFFAVAISKCLKSDLGAGFLFFFPLHSFCPRLPGAFCTYYLISSLSLTCISAYFSSRRVFEFFTISNAGFVCNSQLLLICVIPTRNTTEITIHFLPHEGTKNSPSIGLQKEKDKKEKCIIRESNTGLVDGNDEFYH
jgi:hypothetical protein